MNRVGIIGLGFVGSAIYSSWNLLFQDELTIVDPAKGHTNTINDLKDHDAVFVCVPSPSNKDGSCNSSILESVLAELKQVGFAGVIISKVTAPPSVYQPLQELYPNLVHAPEFLTAANAKEDYRRGTFCIIGGAVTAYRNEAERIIRLSQPNLNSVMHCSIGEASLAKYIINSFLATKVVYMNELAKLAQASGCDWEMLRQLVTSDSRIGSTHTQVPGPDGSFGFGGMCFPKDTAALLKFAEEKDVQLSVLDTAVKTNLVLRLTEPK